MPLRLGESVQLLLDVHGIEETFGDALDELGADGGFVGREAVRGRDAPQGAGRYLFQRLAELHRHQLSAISCQWSDG
jgi:hypothetical protein